MTHVFDKASNEYQSHFLTNMVSYLAQLKDYPRLFKLIDNVDFGRKKLRRDFSGQDYKSDIEVVQQMLIEHINLTTDDPVSFLENAWRYAVLRCGVNNYSESYTLGLYEALEALVFLGRGSEAVMLVQSMKYPIRKFGALTRVAVALNQKFERNLARSLLLYGWETALASESYKVLHTTSVIDTLINIKCIDDARNLLQTVWNQPLNYLQVSIRLYVALREDEKPELADSMLNQIHTVMTPNNTGARAELVAANCRLGLINQAQSEADWLISEAERKGKLGFSVLYSLASRLAHVGQKQWAADLLDRALGIITSSSEIDVGNLGLVAKQFAELQFFEKARAVVDIMPASSLPDKRLAFSQIAQGYARARQYESAWDLIRMFSEKYASYMQHALVEIVRALSEDGKHEEALSVLAHLSLSNRSWGLCNMTLGLIHSGNVQLATTTFQEAERLIFLDATRYTAASLTREMANFFAKQGAMDFTIMVFKRIPGSPPPNPSILVNLIDELCNMGLLGDALSVIELIPSTSREYVKALSSLAATLYRAGHEDLVDVLLDLASRYARNLVESKAETTTFMLLTMEDWEHFESAINEQFGDRTLALVDVCQALVLTERIDKALLLAKEFPNDWRKAIGYAKLIPVLVSKGRGVEAEEIYQSIVPFLRKPSSSSKSSFERDYALGEVAIAFARATLHTREFSASGKLISEIEDKVYANDVLLQIANIFIQAGLDEHAKGSLQIMQYMLEQAATEFQRSGLSTSYAILLAKLGMLTEAQELVRLSDKSATSRHRAIFAIIKGLLERNSVVNASALVAQEWAKADAMDSLLRYLKLIKPFCDVFPNFTFRWHHNHYQTMLLFIRVQSVLNPNDIDSNSLVTHAVNSTDSIEVKSGISIPAKINNEPSTKQAVISSEPEVQLPAIRLELGPLFPNWFGSLIDLDEQASRIVEKAWQGDRKLLLMFTNSHSKMSPFFYLKTGVIAELTAFARDSDGRMKVEFYSLQRARINNWPISDGVDAFCSPIDEIVTTHEQISTKELMIDTVQLVYNFSRRMNRPSKEAIDAYATSEHPGYLADSIAMSVNFGIQEHNILLNIHSPVARLRRVNSIMKALAHFSAQ